MVPGAAGGGELNLAVGWATGAVPGACDGGAGDSGTVFAPAGAPDPGVKGTVLGALGGAGGAGAPPGAGGGGAPPGAGGGAAPVGAGGAPGAPVPGFARKVMRTVSFFKGTVEVLAVGFAGGLGGWFSSSLM